MLVELQAGHRADFPGVFGHPIERIATILRYPGRLPATIATGNATGYGNR